MVYDFFIVGAGLCGSVLAERLASQLDRKVLVVDRRNHIGGNCFDYRNEDGLFVHKYGPHWFHTSKEEVFQYLSKFTKWTFHEHRVRSYVDGELYPFPINRETLNKLYGLHLRNAEDVRDFLDTVRVPIKHPENAEEYLLSRIGFDLYEKFFKSYTIKQWDRDPKELPVNVVARIPVHLDDDDRYFRDKYQGVPRDGYQVLFENLLSHPNITILTGADYRDVVNDIAFDRMIYTGAIDEYFDYLYGKLSYRSVRFEFQRVDMEYFQDYQQVNFPNTYKFTRIVEVKHVTGQCSPRTAVSYEYPCDPAENGNEKFYPVPTAENRELYKKYRQEAKKLKTVIFCGRLAEYAYLDMDEVVARALRTFKKILTHGL